MSDCAAALSGGQLLAHHFASCLTLQQPETDEHDGLYAGQEETNLYKVGLDGSWSKAFLGDAQVELFDCRLASCVTAADYNSSEEASWTGAVPVRVYKNARFSPKLFVGGLPVMAKCGELQKAFGALGNVRVILPKTRGSSGHANGYCHIVARDGKAVKRVLAKCLKNLDNPADSITRIVQNYDFYYELQLSSVCKRVQIIPWCIDDSHYANEMNSGRRFVVFVGALHGIMTAEFLGRVMSDLFGNIEFVTLDTDRFEYPIGSAKVGFTSQESYHKAINTNYVTVKTSKFLKVIQIEPFLEESTCSVCNQRPGGFFCKSSNCFRYFCPACWVTIHSGLSATEAAGHVTLSRKKQQEVK